MNLPVTAAVTAARTRLARAVIRVALTLTGAAQELLATVALLLLQPLLRRCPAPVHITEDDVEAARVKYSVEALSEALTRGLAYRDTGAPLNRPVVVRAADDRVDAMQFALAELAELDAVRRQRETAEREQRVAALRAQHRLHRAAAEGRVRELPEPRASHEQLPGQQLVIAVDPARGGDDATVLAFRQLDRLRLQS